MTISKITDVYCTVFTRRHFTETQSIREVVETAQCAQQPHVTTYTIFATIFTIFSKEIWY